ncbi:MAG: VOC family protein [Propionibacteriaceae bacterium]|nr:VOC family protein [Propionibacteriaceae bacterium]
MHIDHVVYAVGPAGLKAEATRFEERLGVKSIDGGLHPRFGTRMRLIPMTDGRYIEIAEVLDHPAADKAPYGRAVRARSELGGGWLGWAISVPDLAPIEQRLGRQAVIGTRHFPDGRLLEWRQLGVKGLIADPQLPYFLSWVSEPSILPSALPGLIGLARIDIAGCRDRVEQWLGAPVAEIFDGVAIHFDSPSGYPGITAVGFDTAQGLIRI